MRYKDLITVLLLVATATWIWAEPSPEVTAPTQSVTAQTTPQGEAPKAFSWANFDEDDFALGLTVVPGENLESTTFHVTLVAPEGFDFQKEEGHEEIRFVLSLDDNPERTWSTTGLEQVGANRWRFRGSDLVLRNRSYFAEEKKPLPTLTEASLCRVQTHLRDGRQSRYSRGAAFLTIVSDPVQLALR